MIRSVSIIIMWIVAFEVRRIILLHSASADVDRGNGNEEEKWYNETDDVDYSDNESIINETLEDNDIYAANIIAQRDRIIEWKDVNNSKEHLINDEIQDDNNIITAIIINSTIGNGSDDENISTKESKDDNCSTEETNIVDYSQSISSTPKDHIWMKNGNINDDFDVVIKTNVKRVKHVSRAGNFRKVRLTRERHNSRSDNSNLSRNHYHHKHNVTDN